MKTFFTPRLPSEEWKRERIRVAKKAPHLALVGSEPKPDPEMFRWFSIAELMENRRG